MQHITLGLSVPVIDIEKIGKKLEGKERNSNGQGQLDRRKIFLQQKSQLSGRKGKILKDEQHAQMKGGAKRKP